VVAPDVFPGEDPRIIRCGRENTMEFLVEFVVEVPKATADAEIHEREAAEARAAAKLVADGHLVRLWKPPMAPGETRILGLYRAADDAELRALLEALPLYDWMTLTITPLAPHPNDPAKPMSPAQLPHPKLRHVYRVDAALAAPIDLGDTPEGHRRIVALTGGRFTGPQLNGILIPGASADWQIIRPDGVAVGDIRYTLRTDDGALLYVRSRSLRHGPPEVLERLARGEDVSAGEYTFRGSAQISTSAPDLLWLNDGVFVAVGGRQPDGVAYDVYLVE
jgi:muconolactone delta-isomerase